MEKQIDKKPLYELVKTQSREFDKSQNVAIDQTFDWHIQVVINNALRLGKLYGGDLELLEISALFHDYANLIDYKKNSKTHHIVSGELAEPILLKAGYSQNFVDKVKKCIFAHRGSVPQKKSTIEEIILADADAMCHIENVVELFIWMGQCGKNVQDGNDFVKSKVKNSFAKLSERTQEMLRPKYDAIMLVCLDSKPSQKIVDFVVKHILTEYAEKLPYKRNHIDYVIRRSVAFANQVKDEPINVDMAYIVASYHDIGEPIDRKTHEIIGADILRNDKRLQEFFTPEQIETMAQAVQDHRASGKTEPRTIYGKIVSSADRTTDVDDVLRLSYGFRLRQGMTELQGIIDNGYEHLCDKFGEKGYAVQKMYFNDPEFDRFKKECVALSKDKAEYTKRFIKANNIKV